MNSARRSRTRSTLIMVILATIPCYCLGLIMLDVGQVANRAATQTPTATVTAVQGQPSATPRPSQTAVVFPSATPTPTITITWTPSATFTQFVPPTSTPTDTPTPSGTPTETEPPLDTETPTPTEEP